MQVQAMEDEEVPEGTGNGEWKRRQEGEVDMWVTRGGEAVLQLQHRDVLKAGIGGGEGSADADTQSGVLGARMGG